MKVLLALFKDSAEAERIARTMPSHWNVNYANGSTAAGDYMREHVDKSPKLLLIKRPKDHTVIAALAEMVVRSNNYGVHWVAFLSSRDLVREHPLKFNPPNNMLIVEFDRETWARNIGTWEWEMMYEYLVTHSPNSI